ncbi:MAG: hypothetical protein WKF77_19690 [Planctomycetaceae bacterium]
MRPTPFTCILMVAAASSLLSICGCHLQERPASLRVPAVATRFTSKLLPTQPGCPPQMPLSSGLPSLQVGLAMQSFNDPVHLPFASQLGTMLIRELQLSCNSMQVQPVTMNLLPVASEEFHGATPSDVISVSFQEPMNVRSPNLPPVPFGNAAGRPPVDQILVIRILEYRPYYPMRATLEIKVLQGESEEPLFATTANWNAADYGLVEPRPKRRKRHLWFGEAQPCDPNPGHNSPDALMHEIAGDITLWYTTALNPPPLRKSRQ